MLPSFASLLMSASLIAGQAKNQNETPGQEIDSESTEKSVIERIEILGERSSWLNRHHDLDATQSVDRLRADYLRSYGSHSLADALRHVRGIETQTLCANCGAKRLTINGLRGEHTTILIDDFPMHSAVSSFYGIDAIPVVGIDEVLVARGAGSSLISPEAIGGTINLKTTNPIGSRLELMTESGSHGSHQSSVLATASSQQSGIMLSGQQGEAMPWDIDGNGVAESPYRKTQSATVKLVQSLGVDAELVYRHSLAQLSIVGGNTKRFRPPRYPDLQAQPEDFVDGDVRQAFIGDLARITDVVELRRREDALALTWDIGESTRLQAKTSVVRQEQEADYSHAYDYNNRDLIRFYDIKFQRLWGNYSHILSLGIDHKDQIMRSESEALYELRQPPLRADDLNFQSVGIYILNQWSVTRKLDIDMAIRADQLAVEWLALERQLEDTIFAPRIDIKYLHTDHISSRLSYGLGYRPPLTLFESEHGADHSGFLILIDEIEKADSLVYSFSMNYPRWFVTLSGHYTKLSSMAYADTAVARGRPIEFKNSSQDYEIIVTDLFFGGKPFDWLTLQLSYEQFYFSDSYARKLPTAAVEQRWKLDLDANWDRYSLAAQAIYTGPRNLSRYGYDEHYNRYNLDITSAEFGQVSELKNQNAPGFWLVNTSLAVQLSRHYQLLLRADNLFNFTQTGWGDSPTTWHWHVNHAHFDNFHTWGPLSGREYFVGLKASW